MVLLPWYQTVQKTQVLYKDWNSGRKTPNKVDIKKIIGKKKKKKSLGGKASNMKSFRDEGKNVQVD